MKDGLRRKLARSNGSGAAVLGVSVSSTGVVSSNLGLVMGRTFSVGVNEAQRRHAISANANFLIPKDYVPAVRLVLEDGDELTAVVQILEATRSRPLARTHWPPPPFSSLISYAERQRSPYRRSIFLRTARRAWMALIPGSARSSRTYVGRPHGRGSRCLRALTTHAPSTNPTLRGTPTRGRGPRRPR